MRHEQGRLEESGSSLHLRRPFSDFEPYIVTRGLDEETSSRFIDFLRGFFDISAIHWQPGYCKSIPRYLQQASLLAVTFFPDGVETVGRHWMGRHYWLELRAAERLVVDPTGVPLSMRRIDLENIHPFFGLVNASGGFPRTVYTCGVDLPSTTVAQQGS